MKQDSVGTNPATTSHLTVSGPAVDPAKHASPPSPAQTSPKEDDSPNVIVLLEFLYRIAQAYIASGEQTAQVELLVRRIATAYGMRRVRVVAFPSAIFISLDDGDAERVTLAEGPIASLRLDQIADVYTLGSKVQNKEVSPAQGLKDLTAILRSNARFGPVGVVIGHSVLAVGLAMVLMPTAGNLISAVVLGALVGLLKVIKKGQGVLAVPLSVVAAAVVSFAVFTAAKYGLPVEPLHALVPPLVTFLPGAMLAMGMVELAYGDIISGSSRLVNGFVQLVLLAFGLAVGAALSGVGASEYLAIETVVKPAFWVPWAGVLIYAVGVHWHFSAPKGSLPWVALAVLTTYAAQRSSSGMFGSEFSGFFGTLVATPLVYLIQLKFKGPPAIVTFLPCFWLLVPGALGLISVKQMLSDRAAGIEGLTSAMFVFAAIALGTLMGASLYKWLTETFASWQLQIGRVARRTPRRGGGPRAKTEIPKDPVKPQTDTAAAKP
jgi:uncharacterized membrane protein YjjP (DUF1212 family)